jgi:aminoglycoside phosphotransferase (APT) family kinase protein
LLSSSIQQFLPGRSLEGFIGEPSASDLERLVTDAGETLARVHSVVPDDQRGIRYELRLPEEREVARVAGIVREALSLAAAAVVERGADFLRQEVTTRTAPPFSLAHGDFCPKDLLVHDGTVVGVVDWEFAGPASPAYDLAQWEVDAGAPLPAFAVDWALEKLGWKNPCFAGAVPPLR